MQVCDSRTFKLWTPLASEFFVVDVRNEKFVMKEGFDKEIDSLLRRRARSRARVRDDDDGSHGPSAAVAHLDADELSAFAEGALPAAARGAVASHLADCDECRGVVVGLARVAGFEVESEEHATASLVTVPGRASVAGWRVWMRSLFAPSVLRYVAPALALCMVAVVSYVALRSRQVANDSSSRMARSERRRDEATQQAASATAPESTETANANASAGGLTDQAANDSSGGAHAANSSTQTSAGKGHGAAEAPAAQADTATDTAAPPPPPPAAASEVSGGVAASAPKSAPADERELAKAENREQTDSKERAARGAEPEDVTASDQPLQQKRVSQTRPNEVQAPDGSRNQSRSSNNVQSNIAGIGGAATSTRADERDSNSSAANRPPAARHSRSDASGGERSEDDGVVRAGETKAAAGHRFRRDGGAWVDVNYKSSMSSTGVRRGSEAFRALVADLPELGRIAEQIGGEVVVVVHGRAYRIR